MLQYVGVLTTAVFGILLALVIPLIGTFPLFFGGFLGRQLEDFWSGSLASNLIVFQNQQTSIFTK